jgi:tRNA modification GTPase
MENDAADSIDAAAQIHRDQQQERADLKLVCRDASDADWCPVNGDDSESFRELAVWTKCDQAAGALSVGGIPTSSVTGEGIETLKRTISERLCRTGDSESAVVQATAERCQESMRRSLASIDSARSLNRRIAGEELVAAEIRAALDELGRVVGSVYTEDLLDRIFSRFCIGK